MKKFKFLELSKFANKALPFGIQLFLNIYLTFFHYMSKIAILFFLLFISCAQDEINPSADYVPKIVKGYVIQHTYYTLSYSPSDRQAEYAFYYLSVASINGKQERTDNFRIDPSVKSNPVTSTSYQGSGFDRGHLAPAADFKLNEKAMSETFFMSNMSPMTPSFNRGIWSNLEDKVRENALSLGGVYVVTGPVLSNTCGTIGAGITVPCSFYKVIFKEGSNPKMIGFLLSNSGSSLPLKNFIVSVDEIEKLTNLDFFSSLSDDLEGSLEANKSPSGWNF
jgi:endonuclease G